MISQFCDITCDIILTQGSRCILANKGGLDHALTYTAIDIRVRPQGCRPLADDSELRVTEAGRLDSERVTVRSGMDQPASEYRTSGFLPPTMS